MRNYKMNNSIEVIGKLIHKAIDKILMDLRTKQSKNEHTKYYLYHRKEIAFGDEAMVPFVVLGAFDVGYDPSYNINDWELVCIGFNGSIGFDLAATDDQIRHSLIKSFQRLPILNPWMDYSKLELEEYVL
jgi:hypothetical protein